MPSPNTPIRLKHSRATIHRVALALAKNGPTSAQDLCDTVFLSRSSTVNILQALRAGVVPYRLARIARYAPPFDSRVHTPLYAFGNGARDASVKPVDRAERQRIYRTANKAWINAKKRASRNCPPAGPFDQLLRLAA